MSSPEQPDDFLHLPTAAGGADAARRAKAALWQEIAEKRKAKLAAEMARQPQPEPEVVAELPQEAEFEPQPEPLADDWAELMHLDPELDRVQLPPLQINTPAPQVNTPVEVETRGDMSSRKRSVIRRRASPEPDADAGSITKVFLSSPAPKPEPRLEKQASNPEIESPQVEAKPEELTATAETEPEVQAEQSDKTPASPSAKEAGDDTKSDDAEAPQEASEIKKKWLEKWDSWGGRSLAISLAIHTLIIGSAGVLVVNQGLLDQQVDFLPGGTKQGAEASQALEHKVQQKKKTWLNKPVPMRKIASINSVSEIVLPDEVPDLLDLPESKDMLSSSMGASGLGGAGGGFGKGMGLGSKGGMVFQPLSMFGREIKAKKLALVLDVSGSMAPFLPRVIEEVDKVARDSIVVLYVGCGLDKPPTRGLEGEDLFRTSGTEFEKFWRMGGMATLQETRKFKFSKSDVIPMESVYQVLAKRPNTWFIHYLGSNNYTWLALLSEQVRPADALYWFSDFQDPVNFQQVLTVKENLQRRKQKLYIQPYGIGSGLDLVKSQLVEPTGGDVIEATFE
jgi:hypothetical protein